MNKSFFTKIFSAFLIVMLALGVIPITPAYAATSGPNIAGTGANVTGVGTIAWTNPGFVTTNDTNYATAVLTTNAVSNYLRASNFGFSIPAGATINGIQVTINRSSSANTAGFSIRDSDLFLTKNGTATVGTDHASATDWPTGGPASANYGGIADLWGTTWTPAEINSANFGVLLSVLNESGFTNRTASVDYIEVTVTYTIQYTITATAGVGGTISPSGAVLVNGGANQTFNIVPSVGNIVAGVSIDGGASVGRVNSYTFTNVNANHTISSTFENGWTQPTADADNGWTNEANAYVSDNAFGVANNNNEDAEFFTFGLTIPGGATINGIEVAVEGNATGTREVAVDLSSGAGYTTGDPSTTFTNGGTDATLLFGGNANLWGRAWTPTDISTLRVRLTSNNGTGDVNIDQVQVKVHYTLPNTAPNAPSAINQYRTDATTVIAQGGYTNQTQAVFKATATDPEANQYQLQVEVQPNASAFTNTATCTSPLTNSGTETSTGSCGAFVDGTSYKWQYRLLDSVGAATAWTSFGGSDPDFTVDSTVPDTTITANPTNPTNSASASFSFTGSDPGGSGVASFQCQLDGGAFSACTSPQIYLGLSDGSHTFQVRAIDNAGNTDLTPASYTWTVDTTAPAAPVVTTPANGSVTNDSTPSVSGTAEPNSTVTVYIDGSIAGTTTADGSGNWNFTAAVLSDGSHTVRATSTDGVGNTSPDSNTNTFTVDTIAPAAPVVTTPVNGSTINDSTPSVSGTAEPNSTVTVYIDGSIAGTTTADGSGNWNFTTAALSDGSHTVRATATDTAGNTSADSNTNTFTVDTTAPDTTIDTHPTDPSNDTTPTFTFSSPDLTATFECSIDGGAFSACTSPNTLAALADGPHTFAVRAIDLLGNVDPSPASYTWTINTSAPIVTNVTSSTADGTYFPSDVINIQVTFDEAVTVTGTPLLLLELGAVDGLANYVSGSGTNTLTFTYTVVPGDITPDLDYVDTASVTLNGGSIQDAALNNANLTLPTPGSAGSLGANKNIVIDTLILVVTNNGISSIPDTGDGSLSENEQVANTLNINQLVVNFNKDVYDVPASTTDPDEVDNPANYILVRSATGVFNTLSCAAGVVAPDIINPVTAVTYSDGGGSGPFVATVTLSTPLTTDGYYRLFVCGTTSIVQANNTALALAGNGIANGTDFIRNFQLITPAVGGGGGGAGVRDDAKLAVAALPATGFAPGRITALPVQPDELAYSDLGDLWIEIPSLGIKTSIIGVPQTAEGEWDVTWLANNVGWLNGTAFPTWEGNSVVTAHVTNADGVDGPFANLKKLKYGDQIIIHLYGQKYIFEVRNSRLSRPFTTGFAFEDLEDASYLTLITCQTYLPKSDTYMHRRVIRAVLISVENE